MAYTPDEPTKFASHLIQAHGLDGAINVVMIGIEKAHAENDLYRLSVWREVKKILAATEGETFPDGEDD